MLLGVSLLDGCPICDACFSVEERRFDMGDEVVQRTYHCEACGWHDMTIFDGLVAS